ncbi:uncharacterized protein LOC144136786 isoform X2 [Amblyomma americanum]
MTATWVGAGYINGSAEAVFSDGLVWCQAPFGYALSLVIGGLFFAGRMRATRAMTMLDPFQQFYGPWIAVLLCVPAICGEVFWTASNLSALGDTVSTIAYLNKTFIIIASTLVIVFYTSVGGLTSVMYTDVFQLGSTVFGLWVCVPFVVATRTPAMVSDAKKDWLGVIEDRDVSQIFDQLFMTIFGGIPWQVYFQRVLSSDSAFSAKMLSYLSAVGCVFLALPPVIIGAAGKGASFFVGFVVRALCGEPEMGIPVLLRLPQYDNQRGQQFPFRTMCMLISMCTHIGVSMLAAYAFRSGLLEPNKDVWGCFWEISGASTGIMPAVDSPLLVSGGTIAAGSSGNAREQREPSRSDVVIGQQRSNLAAPSLEPSGKGVVPSAPTTPTTPVSELEAEPTSEKSKRSIAGGEGPRAKKAPMALDANPKEAQDPMKTPAYQADDKLRTDKPINRRQSVVSKSSGGSKTRRPSVFGTELSTSTDMPRSRRQSVVSKSSGGSNTRRASVFNAELSTGMPRSRRQSVVSKSSGGSKTKQTGMTAAEPKNGGSGKAEPKSDKPKSTRLSVSSKSSGSDPKTKQTGVADTEPKGSGTRSKQLPAVSDTESLAGVPRTEGTAASADPELAKSNRQVNKRPSATEPDTKSGVRDDQLRDGPDADPKIRAVSTKYVAQQADAAKAPAKSKGHKSDAAGNKDRKTRKKE